MLNEFHVENFRAFRRLNVNRLGQVNLIVGKNTVGKTTLLEALWLYAARMRPDAIWRMLEQRQEFLVEEEQEASEIEVDVPALFYGREYETSVDNAMLLGSSRAAGDLITARVTWVERELTSEPSTSGLREVSEEEVELAEGAVFRALAVSFGAEKPQYIRLSRPSRAWMRNPRIRTSEGLPPFLRAEGTENETIARWWDAIALTEAEERVLDFVRLLAPVERIAPADSPRPRHGKVFRVRLRGSGKPQPLRSLGEGVERMFRTALALEYARRSQETTQASLFPLQTLDTIMPNVLFIDEFEAGVHHSAIAQHWSYVLKLASASGVQVFATTHSWDCLRGFAEAMENDEDCDALVIRLEKVEGEDETGAVIIERKDLPIVVRDSIEVR